MKAIVKIEPEEKTHLTIWRILAYFVVYSFLGFLVETVYAMLTMGVVQSRQSVLYGPFCTVYGLGAVIMIVALQSWKKNRYTLFVGGFLIGSVVEYVISLVGELIFHVKWWDYSNVPLNINGRICVSYSFFWGLLGIYLISHLNPKIDAWLDRVKEKVSVPLLRGIEIAMIIFLAWDHVTTGLALEAFFVRTVVEKDIAIAQIDQAKELYEEWYQDEKEAERIYRYWGDEKMLRTFPNLKIQDKNGTIIYFDNLYPEIQTYYLKIK